MRRDEEGEQREERGSVCRENLRWKKTGIKVKERGVAGRREGRAQVEEGGHHFF